MKINKRLRNKILKICGSPEDFCYEYVSGSAGFEEGFRRMKEYISAVNKVIKKNSYPDSQIRDKKTNI